MRAISDRIANWLRRQATSAGARGLVVGLSGGIDSACVARLAQMAFPDNVLAVLLPCHSDPQDESDARFVAQQFKLPHITIDLSDAYDGFVRAAQQALAHTSAVSLSNAPADDIRARVPLANIKPRLRMTTLYYIANRLNYLVAGTGNLSEVAIGYFTKYGDGGVDLLPLGKLVKSEVRALARELGVPNAIVQRPPSAGLWLGQTDEEEMGFLYADLEKFLQEGPEALAPALTLRIERLVRSTEHKRTLPPVWDKDSET